MVTDRELLERYMALVAGYEGVTFLQYARPTAELTEEMIVELKAIEAGPVVQKAL